MAERINRVDGSARELGAARPQQAPRQEAPPAAALIALQRSGGNQAVVRMLERKLGSSPERTRSASDESPQQVAGDPVAMQVSFLQRSIGNAATARILTSPRPAPAQAPGLLVQRHGGPNDATASDEDMKTLSYAAITKAVGNKIISYKNIQLQPNGELFVELREKKPKPDNVKSQAQNSWDEKLHVPATADDIATRTDIVTKLCLEKGFTAFKTTRPEKMANVQPGSPMIWQTLKEGGLADDEAYDDSRGIQAYLTEALSAGKRKALHAFLEKRGRLPQDPSMYGDSLSLVMDGVVADSGVFPSEQRGREITIYIDPGFKPEAWWATFAKTLVERMHSAGLPRLPIAVGDQQVTGEGALVDGVVHAYFSSRDEAMAMDTVFQTHSFPIWYGGAAAEARAPGKSLVFDMDLNEHGMDVDIDTEEDETTVVAQVQPGYLERFVGWLTSWFVSQPT